MDIGRQIRVITVGAPAQAPDEKPIPAVPAPAPEPAGAVPRQTATSSG